VGAPTGQQQRGWIARRRAGRAARALLVLGLMFGLIAIAPSGAMAGRAQAHLPRRDLLERAIRAYQRLEAANRIHNRVLTVIDYSMRSSERRLWVLDPHSMRVLFHDFVAHGRGSAAPDDPDRAVRFGNEPESHQSSVGLFLTGDTYRGRHGESLELVGLEPGVNDRALERRIVIHPADYASASFRAQSGGRLGRSFGCPALDPAVARPIIDTIRGGSVLYASGSSSSSD
jgi:hypothetical protein